MPAPPLTRRLGSIDLDPRRLARFSGFLAIPMLGAATPLLAIPAISSEYGANGWAAIALGQSIGLTASIIVELGWTLTGPQEVAATRSTAEQARLFDLALRSKLVAAIAVVPIVGLLAWALAGDLDTRAVVVTTVGTCIGGLTPSWFFLGSGQPSGILLTESLPRLAAALLAATAISQGLPLWIFGATVAVAAIYAPLAARRRSFRDVPRQRIGITDVTSALRSQRTAVGGRFVSGTYITLPITLVHLVRPDLTPVFAAIERTFRIGLLVVQAFPNAMQKWLGQKGSDDVRRAIRIVVVTNIAVGIACAITFAALGPWIIDILFHSTVDAPRIACLCAGAVVAITCTSRATGSLALVKLDATAIILRSALIGAAAGVGALLVLPKMFGLTGAFCSEIIAEAAVLAYQTMHLRRLIATHEIERIEA